MSEPQGPTPHKEAATRPVKSAEKPRLEYAKKQQIDGAIGREAGNLEANVNAATAAIADAGGEDAIKKALGEMPADAKEALRQKLEAEHTRIMENRKRALENSLGWMKEAGEAIINPFYIADKDAPIITGALGLTLWSLGQQQIFGLGLGAKEGVKAIKAKIGMMRESRRHNRELKALEKPTPQAT